ncbi:MAG: YceH family protein, partial [Ilumatobacter sp.]
MDRTLEPMGLNAAESRVLGCLIEKESTTPDAYPLTVNSLRNACNQSTSRAPVMELTEYDVQTALDSLRERGLTRTVHSTSNRAAKFRHVLPDVLQLDAGESALISVLLLRGEQTIGELKARADRQHSFGSIDVVAGALGGLAGRDVPLVRRLDRQPGQKDARWTELLSTADASASTSAASTSAASTSAASTSAASTSAASPSDARVAEAGEVVVDVATSDDPYGAATAEFYDLLATAHWDSFGFQLLDLLADADPTAGPIVDLGAGTG